MGDRVNVPDLASLDAEDVTVRGRIIGSHSVQLGETNEDVHHAHLLIDNVPPVRDLDGRRIAVGRVGGKITSRRVRPTLEPAAGGVHRNDNAGIVEAVEIGIARRLDNLAAIPLSLGYGSPVL